MTVTILTDIRYTQKILYGAFAFSARVGDHHGAADASLAARRAAAGPWATVSPGPARPGPPRSCGVLATASISPPRDHAHTSSANGAREAVCALLVLQLLHVLHGVQN